MSDFGPVIKRILDVAAAILGLALFALPMAIVAGLIRLRMGSPILYRVPRPGLHAEPFLLYKFRTMKDLIDPAGKSLSDRERITPLGRLLRKTSLDELPQLVNVLNGDMSLVGPRPLSIEYLKILLQTVVSVLRRDSVSLDGDLDVPSFTGSLPTHDAHHCLHRVPSGPSSDSFSMDIES